MSKDKDLDREVKTRRAEGKVKDLVSRTAKGTSVGEQVRQEREVKTRAAESKVKEAVSNAAKKTAKAAPKQSLLARAGAATRGALAKVRGRGGPIGLLALGASASMEAGHQLDKYLANRKSEPEKKPKGGSPKEKKAAAKPKAKAESKPKASPKPSAKKGAYPVYKKDSTNAASFRTAFAAARKAGKAEFTWEGRRYNTKLK